MCIRDSVRDQLAVGHAAADLGAQLGVVLDVPAEDVADADVFQVVGFGEELGLGAFPAALDAHDDVLVHPSHPSSCAGTVSRVRCWTSPRALLHGATTAASEGAGPGAACI